MATEVLHLDGEVLAGAYRYLSNAKQGFDQARDVAEDVRTAIGQPEDMATKVTAFADSWSVNRGRLSKSVGKLAEKLKGIIDSFEDLDTQFGQVFADATDTTSGDRSGGAGGSATGSGSTAGSAAPGGAGFPMGRSSGAAVGGTAYSSGTALGGSSGTAPPSTGGANTTSAQATSGSPGTAPSQTDSTEGPTAPVSDALPGVVSGGVAAMGSAAFGAGSAAAVGSLYRAWSGQSRGTSPAPVAAQSRATIAEGLRGMSTTPGGSSVTSSMSRGDVASLMKKGGSGYVPMGLQQSGGQTGKPDRERRSRISPPPGPDAERLDHSAGELGGAEPQDERDPDPRNGKGEAK